MHQNHDLRRLSLTARLAVALVCFERYCHDRQLATPEIVAFLDFLWDFPILDSPLAFQAWERRQPELVTIGLGDDMPDTYFAWLDGAGITADIFRQLVEHTVEIVYGSFYGAVADDESLAHLQQVLAMTEQTARITLLISQFAQSRFADRQGWGEPLSVIERDAWRVLAKARRSSNSPFSDSF